MASTAPYADIVLLPNFTIDRNLHEVAILLNHFTTTKLTMANGSEFMICLTLLLLAFLTSHEAQGTRISQTRTGSSTEQGSLEEYYVPVQKVVYRTVAVPTYEPTEVCSGCRCCKPSNTSNCVDTKCCYAINCNIPGKPYGQCSFTPVSCDCGPNNCNNPSSSQSVAHLIF
ncbi:hypothetical protein ACP70R_020180 [Stipagrostis hirtigluma subsp. patula]